MRLACLFCLACLLGGCSWIHQFIIENRTNEPIEVQYKLTTRTRSAIFKPSPTRAEAGKRTEIAHTFDEATQIVSFTCPPRQKVAIGYSMSQCFDDYFGGEAFNLAYLTLRRAGKEIQLSPAMIRQEVIRTKTNRRLGRAILHIE